MLIPNPQTNCNAILFAIKCHLNFFRKYKFDSNNSYDTVAIKVMQWKIPGENKNALTAYSSFSVPNQKPLMGQHTKY